jgi:thiol-disulfide isomerase/thioredoxin
MKRHLLLAAATAALSLPRLARADDRLFYTSGLAEAAMDAGKVVFLDFWTGWCSTCAAQARTVAALRAANPAYDAAIIFITVDWDFYSDGDLAKALKIPRRSTLVALKGHDEIGRIVAGTAERDIRTPMDAALDAATV